MLPISQVALSSARIAQAQRPKSPGQSAPGADGQVKDPRGAQSSESTQRGSSKSDAQLSDDDLETVRKLQARDTEVRAHEQAHAAAGGAYAGAPSFDMQRGPDGRNYAIGGEVPIDVSAIPGDPQATIIKMMQVKRAALAPQEPSGADRAIAAHADSAIVAARRELLTQSSTSSEASGKQPAGAADGSSQHDAKAGAHSDKQTGAFVAFERRNASVAAYSAAGSFSGVGGGLDRHA